jgi:hypothetical protein
MWLFLSFADFEKTKQDSSVTPAGEMDGYYLLDMFAGIYGTCLASVSCTCMRDVSVWHLPFE